MSPSPAGSIKRTPSSPTSITVSSTPSPSRPTTPWTIAAGGPNRLTAKLQDVRTKLVENVEQSWYLGENAGRENVVWYRLGREEVLLTTAAAQAFDDAMEEFASSTEDENPGLTPPPEPEHALLSAVVQITHEDFWMMSCGRWKGPTTVCREFADVKLTCTGTAPNDSVFRRDFPTVLANLNHLMALSSTGFSLKKGLMVPSRGRTQKIRLRHVLFEPGTSESLDTDERNSDTAVMPEYKIQNWPTISGEAKWALESMHDTHRVLPLQAYSLHGDLIPPSQYQTQLKGATVQVHFILRHWSIAARYGAPGSDTYVADVISMRILVPPKPQTRRAVRRQLFRRDPM